MQTIHVIGEYRKFIEEGGDPDVSLSVFAELKVGSGEWIRDDGDHYLPEVWDAQYDEPSQAAVDNFRSWLDETEGNGD